MLMYLSSTSGWLDITMCIQIVQKHRHLSFCYTLRTPLRYRVSVVLRTPYRDDLQRNSYSFTLLTDIHVAYFVLHSFRGN